MKKAGILVVAITVYVATASVARSNVVKLYGGSPTSVAYERAIGGAFSLSIKPGVVLFQSSYDGFSLDLNGRFYLSKKRDNLDGFFIAIPVGMAFVDYSKGSVNATGLGFYGGLGLGFQRLFKNGFIIDFFAHGTFGYYTVTAKAGVFAGSVGGALPAFQFGFGLGYAF